jgi:8-oxo-dGTP diphosphatase
MPEKLDFKNAGSTASMIVSKDGIGLYLIKRKHEPFKGMWALPGGFHNCDQETLEQTALRELREETSLEAKISDLVLVCVNSDPDRDPRGHVIDHVYFVTEFSGTPKAQDDAKEIEYFKFSNLPKLAFDHKKSIAKFLDTLLSFTSLASKIKKSM